MTEKELLKVLGLDKKMSLEIDLINAMTYKPDKNSLEHDLLKIMGKDGDQYLKQLKEEENKRKEFIKLFNDKYIYNKIKNRLMLDGFVYRCPYCIDLSNSYGRSIKNYKNSSQ